MRKTALKKVSRAAFLRELEQFAAQQRALIEAACGGFDTDPAAGRARVAQQAGDFRFFCRTYLPHYFGEHESAFHAEMFARIPAVLHGTGTRDAIAAPRGEAKSTLVTQASFLWAIVNGLRHYCLMIMDSSDQACTMLEAVKVELEANPRLAQDFPKAVGPGRVWQVGTIVTANNVKVQAFGAMKRLRGLRHGPHRPDYVALDDIENDLNVASPDQRDKRERWVLDAVLKLGPPDGSLTVFYVGTILHFDSVLARFMARPTWRARRYQAIRAWPDRMDLWSEWELILRADGADAARAFYDQRRTAMEEGGEVSWPGVRPLYNLMLMRADDADSFAREMQNDPAGGENCPFAQCVQLWDGEPKPGWLYFGACDPSLGKLGGRGDPSAILVGGYERASGTLHVVQADIRRRPPDRIIADVIEAQRRWNCLLWSVETVQFQEFFRAELVKRAAQAGLHVPARGITPHTDKALRIEALHPHVQAGHIKLHRNQFTLIEQLKHWPESAHDDGPDALEMLWQIARRGLAGVNGGLRTGPKSGASKLLERYG